MEDKILNWKEAAKAWADGDDVQTLASDGWWVSYSHYSTVTFRVENQYRIKPQPKPKVKLAPALYKWIQDKTWSSTTRLYKSKEHAKSDFRDEVEIIWPAVPNSEGMYEIEEGE